MSRSTSATPPFRVGKRVRVCNRRLRHVLAREVTASGTQIRNSESMGLTMKRNIALAVLAISLFFAVALKVEAYCQESASCPKDGQRATFTGEHRRDSGGRYWGKYRHDFHTFWLPCE